MGEFADNVIARLMRSLERERPSYNWQTEYQISGTPVDLVARCPDRLILIELEWRRADPADNTAKIFRHLTEGRMETDAVTVAQLFSNYYGLASGDVSSKRKNAEFVGSVASESLEELTYYPIGFDIDPPKSGEERPARWEETTESMVEHLSSVINWN